jgi:hypothetical protein
MLYSTIMEENDWIDYGVTDEELVDILDPKDWIQEDAEDDTEDEKEQDDEEENIDDGGTRTGRDIMSMFFNDWDEDDSGFLDIEEVFAGVEKFSDAMNLDYDSRRTGALFDELDTDGNQELDRKEFIGFLLKFAEQNEIGMEDLAFVMADQISQREADADSQSKKRRNTNPTDFFKALFSVAAFQRGQKKEGAATVNAKTSVPQQSLSAFLKRFGAQRQQDTKDLVEEEELALDETTIVEKLGFDDSSSKIEKFMWDIPTDDKNVFTEAGLKKYYGDRGGY